jgi:hypothetical protein
VETVAFDILPKKRSKKSRRFVVVYHPPSAANNLAETEKLCHALRNLIGTTTNPVFVLGDFNFPQINWSLLTCQSKCATLFLQTCAELNLSQLVLEGTRGPNILDLILTNHPQSVLEVSVSAPFTNTCDHNSIIAKIRMPQQHTFAKTESQNFHKGDYTAMCNYLETVNWNLAFAHPTIDVQDMWNIFSAVLKYCISTFVPQRKPKSSKCPPHIRKLLAKKITAYKNNKSCYKKASREYDYAVKKHHLEIESSLVRANDKTRFFAYVNGKTSAKPCIPPVRTSTGPLLCETSDKCYEFNKFFASTFTTDNGFLPTFPDQSNGNMMSPVLFPVSEVHAVLKSQSPKFCTTPDGFPPILYQSTADLLAYPLSLIFEQSMSSAMLPSVWKTAIVRPIHKKGSRHLVENYRPISLTCIACKMMETIIKNKMVAFLQTHHMISPDQYGFLARRSTGSQLLLCLQKWITSMCQTFEVDIVFMDFAKAFDSVCHKKLLLKLDHYGFKYELFAWLKTFLSDRTQSVQIDDSSSTTRAVISGVPQGSVIGPVLFLIYINDIVSCVTLPTEIKLFADDSKLFLPCKSSSVTVNSPLTSSLSRMVEWCETWQINIAVQKCSILTLFTKPSNQERCYSIQNKPLPHYSVTRDLGLTLASTCKQSLHCENLCKRGKARGACVLKSFVSHNQNLLLSAFKTYVRPICESDTPVWSPHLLMDIAEVECVQREFTRFLFRRLGIKNTGYLDRLNFLHIHSLEYRRITFDLVMCFKIVHHLIT